MSKPSVRMRIAAAVIAALILVPRAPLLAIDFGITIPKPSLPAIPVPKFMQGPKKELDEEDIRNIEEARERREGKRQVTAEFAEERASGGVRQTVGSVRQQNPQNQQNPQGAPLQPIPQQRAPQNAPLNAQPPLVRAGAAPEYAPLIDLSPAFSDRLPYCVALGRVVCESNFPLDQVQGLQAEITQLQTDLTGYLSVPVANEKIELCLFKDHDSYASFIQDVFPGAPLDRPALYVKDSGPGVLMVQRDSNMIVNIRHEMTHAYLNASLRHVPIWLDEGLAKYFETPPGERGFRNPYLKDVEQSASGWFSSPPSLSRLEKLTRVDQMKSREYRESWSWVHFMIHYSHDTHLVLAEYLRSLRPEEQQGISQQDAFKLQKQAPLKKALEHYIPDYERKYVEHFKNWDRRKTAYENAR